MNNESKRIVRIFELLVVAGLIAFGTAKLLEIVFYKPIILALAIGPLALLNYFQAHKTDCSIIFNKYNFLFRLFGVIATIALFWGLYKYGVLHGFWSTILFFLSGVLIQGVYYAILKNWAKSELTLIPLEILGLILFYFYVI